jgi:hypothetical protein
MCRGKLCQDTSSAVLRQSPVCGKEKPGLGSLRLARADAADASERVVTDTFLRFKGLERRLPNPQLAPDGAEVEAPAGCLAALVILHLFQQGFQPGAVPGLADCFPGR